MGFCLSGLMSSGVFSVYHKDCIQVLYAAGRGISSARSHPTRLPPQKCCSNCNNKNKYFSSPWFINLLVLKWQEKLSGLKKLQPFYSLEVKWSVPNINMSNTIPSVDTHHRMLSDWKSDISIDQSSTKEVIFQETIRSIMSHDYSYY